MGSGTATRRAGAPLPKYRCPAGKLLTAGLSKRSPRFPFQRNPLRVPTTSTGRHIYIASPGESHSCPTDGAGTAPGTSPKPRRDPAPKCTFPGAARRRPPARPRSACVRCLQMGERPRGKRPRLLISPSPPLSLPAHPRPAQGGDPLSPVAGAKRRSAAGLGASQGCARREGGLACRRWLGITGSEGARAAGARAAPCTGITRAAPCPRGGGEAAALPGSRVSGRRTRSRRGGGREAGAGRPEPPAPAAALPARGRGSAHVAKPPVPPRERKAGWGV